MDDIYGDMLQRDLRKLRLSRFLMLLIISESDIKSCFTFFTSRQPEGEDHDDEDEDDDFSEIMHRW